MDGYKWQEIDEEYSDGLHTFPNVILIFTFTTTFKQYLKLKDDGKFNNNLVLYEPFNKDNMIKVLLLY